MNSNSRRREITLQANYNNATLYASGYRPFKDRKPVKFQRPPAVYSNTSWEDTINKYVETEIEEPQKKKS